MHKNKEIKKEIDLINKSLEDYAKKSKNRKAWIDELKESHEIIVVIFLSEFKFLIKRNQHRKQLQNKSISKNGVIRKLKTFSFPLLGEGIDKVEYILT